MADQSILKSAVLPESPMPLFIHIYADEDFYDDGLWDDNDIQTFQAILIFNIKHNSYTLRRIFHDNQEKMKMATRLFQDFFLSFSTRTSLKCAMNGELPDTLYFMSCGSHTGVS